ncbi:MAG: hypothetical protein HRU51_00195 [Xanthomonadales bacterium]|nr:hypothetical protein [Xanthomonadales bacterium]
MHSDIPAVPGRALLVLVLVLMALLEFMLGGSKLLLGVLREDRSDWLLPSGFALGFALCYAVLAHGVWFLRVWTPMLTVLLTLLVLAYGLLRFIQDREPDLALILVFLLAMATNLAALAWAHSARDRLGQALPDSARD